MVMVEFVQKKKIVPLPFVKKPLSIRSIEKITLNNARVLKTQNVPPSGWYSGFLGGIVKKFWVGFNFLEISELVFKKV